MRELGETESGEPRVARNAAYLFITNVYRIAFNTALFLVIARALGADELGRYAFALSYATLFSIAVHLGLNDLIIRQVAVDRGTAPHYFTAALAVKFITGILVTGVTVVTIGLSSKPTSVQELVLAAALTTSFVAGVETIAIALFYAFERMSYILALGIFRSTLNAAVGIAVVWAGWGARGVLWGFLAVEGLAAAIAFGAVIWRLGVRFTPVKASYFPKLLWQSLPFGLSGIFITVYMQLHYSLLSFFVGDAATGLYAAAAKLVTFLAFIPSALTQALYPYLSRIAVGPSDPRAPALRSIRYLTLLAAPAALFLCLRARPIIALVYGDKYASASSILTVLALSLPFVFITYPFAVVLNAIRRERTNTGVTAGAAMVNAAANLILIPLWGPVGAAASFVITEFGQYAARHVLLRICLGPLHLFRNLRRLALPLAAMAATMFLTQKLPLAAETACLAVVYVAAAFAFRAITREEIVTLFRRRGRAA